MLSIYKYAEPHLFLKDAWEQKRAKNPSFSMRAWARKLGFQNNSPLSLMLAGRRPIPKKYVPQIAEDLGLDARSSQYLDALVDYRNAKNAKEQDFYFQRMRSLSPEEPLQRLELEHFKFLSDPIHTIILEMIDLAGFSSDTGQIQQSLRFPATRERIDNAIDRLAVLGLIQRQDGKLIKKQQHIANKPDVPDADACEYHRLISQMASEAISDQATEEREYNSFSLNVARDRLPYAKQLIRTFISDFIKEVEAEPGEARDTFQLNLQFFGLARTENSNYSHRSRDRGGHKND